MAFPNWYGEIPDEVDFAPDAEIRLLGHLIDEIRADEDISNISGRRHELQIKASASLISAKSGRAAFKLEDLQRFVACLVRSIRAHVKDADVINAIAKDLMEYMRQTKSTVPTAALMAATEPELPADLFKQPVEKITTKKEIKLKPKIRSRYEYTDKD